MTIPQKQQKALKELEKQIGKKLIRIPFEDIRKWENGYAVDDKDNVIGLNLEHNQINDITPLKYLTNLTSLDLWNNQINDITPLKNLTNLTSLDLDDNRKIKDITPLTNLTNLTSLSLRRNQINDITPLANLTNLTSLSLRRNQINDITSLKNLTNLTSLHLDYNRKIKDITPLTNLTNLTSLGLENNQINDITPLRVLLENNEELKISAKANGIDNTFYVGDNPLETPPMEIVHQGRKAVLDYFKYESKEKSNKAKIVIVGNTAVGKSTFLHYYLDKEYKENRKSTHGIEIITRKKKGVSVTYWDFGGQEYYHGTYNIFLDNVPCVFIFSAEDESLDSSAPERTCVRRYLGEDEYAFKIHPKTWLSRLERFSLDYIFVQNKCDEKRNDIKTKELQNAYKISLKALAHENKKEIYKNYEEYKKNWKAIEKALEKKIEKARSAEIPSQWKKLFDYFEQEKYEEIFLTPLDIERKWKKILKENSLAEDLDEDDLLISAIKYYKQIGEILFASGKREIFASTDITWDEFKEEVNRIYLNPKYIIDLIYKILDYNELAVKQKNNPEKIARFDEEYLKKIWRNKKIKDIWKIKKNKISKEDVRECIRFMTGTIVFEMEDFAKNKIYVATQYLPEKTEKYKEELNNFNTLGEATITCYFTSLSEDIIVNIISRYGNRAKANMFHRSGIIFEEKNEEGEVKWQAALDVYHKEETLEGDEVQTGQTRENVRNKEKISVGSKLVLYIKGTKEEEFIIINDLFENILNEKVKHFYVKKGGKYFSNDFFTKEYLKEVNSLKNLNNSNDHIDTNFHKKINGL